MPNEVRDTYQPAEKEQNLGRHWSPTSQAYAPADVLLDRLNSGWMLDTEATVETFYYAGYRRVDVFCFTLRRGTESIEMPVLSNPAVDRLLAENDLTVIEIKSSAQELN